MEGDRVTITDVARIAGTSTATVSYYLNGKLEKMSEATRQRIAQAVERTGYVPSTSARQLAGKQSHVIAVLILDNTNAWAGQIVSGIEAAAEGHGFQTVLCNTSFDPERERTYVEKMLSLGVDGFIIQPTSRFKTVNERLRKAGKPVVYYDCNLFDFETTWIKSNLYDGIYSAVSECVDRGYENFVSIGAEAVGRTRTERMQGFSDAVTSRGLEYTDLSITHEEPAVVELGRWVEQSVTTAKRTLVFVQNQWALSRVFKALQPSRGLIPDRIGLLGLNCLDWTSLTTPTVSTVVEPVFEEGKQACQMLMAILDDKDLPPRQKILTCKTNWLESTL